MTDKYFALGIAHVGVRHGRLALDYVSIPYSGYQRRLTIIIRELKELEDEMAKDLKREAAANGITA